MTSLKRNDTELTIQSKTIKKLSFWSEDIKQKLSYISCTTLTISVKIARRFELLCELLIAHIPSIFFRIWTQPSYCAQSCAELQLTYFSKVEIFGFTCICILLQWFLR